MNDLQVGSFKNKESFPIIYRACNLKLTARVNVRAWENTATFSGWQKYVSLISFVHGTFNQLEEDEQEEGKQKKTTTHTW